MKYIVGIFYVNRFDLLMKALSSIERYWPVTHVVDNSWNRELRHRQSSMPPGVKVLEPPVPLSHCQSQNLLHRLGAEHQSDFVIYMHNDAEAYPQTPERLLQWVEQLQMNNVRWGGLFTLLDTLSAFNMQAIREVGSWDPNLPMYFSDIDWYRRMKLLGYEIVESRLSVTHHNEGASTVKSDPYLTQIHQVTFPLYNLYYQAKWGGAMGSETFDKPFNQFPLRSVNYLAEI
ncbi:MAG: glycosyltransferase family 2 protein [Paenibacillus sp.]|nr:glycosyltransferase family 2 protein [Paenibacillus sp.]